MSDLKSKIEALAINVIEAVTKTDATIKLADKIDALKVATGVYSAITKKRGKDEEEEPSGPDFMQFGQAIQNAERKDN